jgi:hypothetical protein
MGAQGRGGGGVGVNPPLPAPSLREARKTAKKATKAARRVRASDPLARGGLLLLGFWCIAERLGVPIVGAIVRLFGG